MALLDLFQRLSQAPTNPHPAPIARKFDVADLYRGPVSEAAEPADSNAVPFDEKLRQAYFWIVNRAIISPHYDIEYNDTPPATFVLGDSKSRLTLPSETPEDFLAEPCVGGSGKIHVAAVVADLAELLHCRMSDDELRPFWGTNDAADRNRLALVLLMCWLLADDCFRQAGVAKGSLIELVGANATMLALQTSAMKYVRDADRREELARLALARVGCRPAGESKAQAQDRLTSISSTERTRVMLASRVTEERARKIREALAKKAAEESADKWTRE